MKCNDKFVKWYGEKKIHQFLALKKSGHYNYTHQWPVGGAKWANYKD